MIDGLIASIAACYREPMAAALRKQDREAWFRCLADYVRDTAVAVAHHVCAEAMQAPEGTAQSRAVAELKRKGAYVSSRAFASAIVGSLTFTDNAQALRALITEYASSTFLLALDVHFRITHPGGSA